jgi:protein SCO1/2
MPALVRLALGVALTLAGLGALAVVVTAGSVDDRAGFDGSVRPRIPPRDFVLRDAEGGTVELSALRGKVVIVTFLYTTCEDTCPVTATQIRGALDDLGRDVPALAVSVDPARDTPERARAFLVRRRVRGRIRFLL